MTEYIEDFIEFREWHKSFSQLITDQYLGKYFNWCQDNHKVIRKEMGGINHFITIETEKYQSKADLDTALVKQAIRYLNASCTNWKDRIGIQSEDELCFPITNINKKFNDIHIDLKNTYITPAINWLNQIWNDYCVQKGTWDISIDTSIQSFCKLGHYNCDKESCFKNEGSNYIHKYRIASAYETFVLKFSKHKQENKDKLIGRAWGFYSPKDKVVNICNYYQFGMNKLTAIECCKWIAAEILHCNMDQIKYIPEMINYIDQDYIWKNHDEKATDWSFYLNENIHTQNIQFGPCYEEYYPENEDDGDYDEEYVEDENYN